MIYAAFRAWKTLRRYFISLPSKTAFYCVTKSREPTTNESDVFSVLVCTLFVSVDDKLVSILPYHRKAKACGDFLIGGGYDLGTNFYLIIPLTMEKRK